MIDYGDDARERLAVVESKLESIEKKQDHFGERLEEIHGYIMADKLQRAERGQLAKLGFKVLLWVTPIGVWAFGGQHWNDLIKLLKQ